MLRAEKSALLRVVGAASVSPVFFRLVISRNVAQPQPLTERAGVSVFCVSGLRTLCGRKEREDRSALDGCLTRVCGWMMQSVR